MLTGMALDFGRPAGVAWNYDRGEIIADGVIHAIGICSGLIGAVIIIVIASHSTRVVAITSVLIYAAGLIAMLGFSAACAWRRREISLHGYSRSEAPVLLLRT
jgi:hemolysin III